MKTTETKTQWQYLEYRPHPWKQQLYLKGSRMRAFTLFANMLANEMTKEEAADNWDLPLAAIDEIIIYCQTHQQLLHQEAEEEERSRLEKKGVILEPKIID